MKRLLFLLLIFGFYTQNGYSQPAGYYNGANGLSGYQLKSALSTIITNGHIDRGYGALYNAYPNTDADNFYDNDGTVLDMYSEIPSGPDTYNYNHGSRTCGNYNSENDCYNREHLLPQSVFSSASPMRSDVHFVVPSDGFVNGLRSSLPFGEVDNPNRTTINGSKRGSNVSNINFTGVAFEPIDEFKGDIARCLLYFATRYETQIPSWNYGSVFDGSSNKVYSDWFLNLLLKWHLQDPVNAREIVRNNASYTFQGNRNPFIDSAQYVTQIWGMPDTVKPSTPLNLIASDTGVTSVKLSWDISSDNVGIRDYYIYQGALGLTNTNEDTILLTGLSPSTTYSYHIVAVDSIGNISGNSDTVTITTKPSPVGIETLEQINFSIYPNPFSNQLIIKTSKPIQVEVYNYTGVLVKKLEVQNQSGIYFNNEPSGIYFINVLNDEQIIGRKRVIKY